MTQWQSAIKRWFFFVLQIVTPVTLISWLFYRSHLNRIPGFTLEDALTVSLAAMQVTLAALAIFIGIAAIVGFQAVQQAAKIRAGEVATKEVKAYLDAHVSESMRDEIKKKLEKDSGELSERQQPERRVADGGSSSIS